MLSVNDVGYKSTNKPKCGSSALDNKLITTSKVRQRTITHDKSFEGFKTLQNDNSVGKGETFFKVGEWNGDRWNAPSWNMSDQFCTDGDAIECRHNTNHGDARNCLSPPSQGRLI
jgi:hypothetical protein